MCWGVGRVGGCVCTCVVHRWVSMDVKDKEGKVYGQCFVSLYTYVLTQQYAPNDRECMPLANGIVGEFTYYYVCMCVCCVHHT